jgi:hypothetical protein
VVNAAIMNPEDARVDVSLYLRRVIHDAYEQSKFAVIERAGKNGEPMRLTCDPTPARQSIIAACKTYADIVGATAARKVAVEISPAQLSAAELAEATIEAVVTLARSSREMRDRVLAALVALDDEDDPPAAEGAH